MLFVKEGIERSMEGLYLCLRRTTKKSISLSDAACVASGMALNVLLIASADECRSLQCARRRYHSLSSRPNEAGNDAAAPTSV